MKILVFVNTLDIGGVEWNSIELAARLRDGHAHQVVLFGTPGTMVKLAEQKSIRFLPAPVPKTVPSLARMRALCAAVRDERPDLLQVWDYRAGLDAYFSAHMLMGVPMHLCHADMEIDRVLPRSAPTTFMTPELVERARTVWRGPVGFIPPPVDIHLNAPEAVDAAAFRELHQISSNELTIVTVSRLANWMKADSLRRTIDAVRVLGRDLPLKFVIVGDGDARPELERLAADANNELGRAAIVLTGPLLDPRPAYAAANIFVGMGGSSLRAMAFGKPVIIVGKDGFSATFTPETAPLFFEQGMYGVGDAAAGNQYLIDQIRRLIESPEELHSLGEFSRQFVERHFSLEAVGTKLAHFCDRAVGEEPSLPMCLRDGIRIAALILGRPFVPNLLRQRIKRRELKQKRKAACSRTAFSN